MDIREFYQTGLFDGGAPPLVVLYWFLVFSATTLVSAVSLWTLIGRSHAGLRIAVLAVVVLAPLTIGAWELTLLFAAQSATIVMLFLLCRRAFQTRSPVDDAAQGRAPSQRFQFSLRALIALVLAAGVFFGLAVKVPFVPPESLYLVVLEGTALGVGALLSAVAAARVRSWWRRSLTLIAAGFAIGTALAVAVDANATHAGGFFMADEGWLKVPGGIPLGGLMCSSFVLRLCVYLGSMFALQACFLAGWVAGLRAAQIGPSDSRRARVLHRAALGARLSLILLPCLGMLAWLLWRFPFPADSRPESESYPKLIALSRTVDESEHPTNENPTLDQWRRYATSTSAPALAARELLVDDGRPRPAPFDLETYLDDVENFRALGRALAAQGRIAEHEGRLSNALDFRLDCLRLGRIVCRGSTATHWLIGTGAVMAYGLHGMRTSTDRAEPQDCRRAIALLETIDAQAEPLDLVAARDRAWEDRANGWFRRVHTRLAIFAGYEVGGGAVIRRISQQTTTTIRQLICEFGLRAF